MVNEYRVNNSDLTAVADAIREKSGTSDPMSFPAGFVEAIAGISTGGGNGGGTGVGGKDVNFYDYDGTLLHSYTVEEAQTLTAMPALPEHSGLICQGWNWSLADIKAHNRAINVGATYITDDGKTRIYITLEDGRTSPMLGCSPNGTVTVDWGDGTDPDVLTGKGTGAVKWTPTHHYAAPGDYVVQLTVDGEMGLTGAAANNTGAYIIRCSSGSDDQNYIYRNAVRRVELGDGITNIDSCAFYNCYALASITIPAGVTSIGSNAFSSCYCLAPITIPDGVTSIGTKAFYNCHTLDTVVLPNSITSIGGSAFHTSHALVSVTIPESVTSIGESAFYNCYALASVTIPESVTSISANTFYNCYALSSATIKHGVTNIGSAAFRSCKALASVTIPESVTSIGDNAFYDCPALASATIPNGVTSISIGQFYYCYALTSVTIPDSVTSIGGNAFGYCNVLASITIPEGVTSIGGGAFSYCYNLSSITIPAGVTSIGSNAFSYCYGVRFYDFSKCVAVPTLASTNVFTKIMADCEIRVPAALYDEWIAATNWTTYASYIVAV